jgi:molecular chaperone HtpG
VDNKYFTLDEYKKLIKESQTDKNKNLVYLYSTDTVNQHSFIEAAKAKGYDVLSMEGQLDTHSSITLNQNSKNRALHG